MIQVIELFLNLMLITHFSAMLWLAVVRHEMNEGGANDTWFDDWNMKDATDFELYIDCMFWATCTMTSIGFGDIIPITKIEKAVSLFVMIIGASTYGSLFGAFVVIIDDLNAEKKEKQEALESLTRWIEVRHINNELKNRLINYQLIMTN
mgnify:CR=1 FL=1